MAASKRPRIFLATAKIDSSVAKEITSSTSAIVFQKAASFSGVRMESLASGRPRRNARTARRLMTASPSQLGERTTKRKG